MITLFHVFIALASCAYLTLLVLKPNVFSFKLGLILIGMTLSSGVILTLLQPSTLAHVCTSGSVYLALAMSAVIMARHRKVKYFTA